MAEEKDKKEQVKAEEAQTEAPAGKEAEKPAAPAAETKTEKAPAETKTKESASEAKTETAVAEKEKPKVQLSKEMESMIKNIEDMSVLQLSDLVKALEEKFGVSAAAPVAAMAVAGAPGAAAGGAEEEKSVFSVVLVDIGAKKINVIKEVRALTDLGLKEAKDLVEAAPKEVKEDIPKEEAEKMKKQLEAAGAKVELR
jgi:large subunit ribosomal protein L7/L12